MNTPTFAEIEATFQQLRVANHEGVSGVLRIDSGRPGPQVGITACTHGNEPSGLAAIWHLLGEGDLRLRLRRGSVLLMLNNLEAAQRYFAHPEFATLRSQDAGSKALTSEWLEKTFGDFRSVDHNMNRLPPDHWTDCSKAYEFARVEQLRPIFTRFDTALDIHSTTQPMQPIIVAVKGDWMAAGLPISTVIDGFVKVQIGRPVSWYYGAADATGPMVAVETGTHAELGALRLAIECAEAFLQATGVVDGGAGAPDVPAYEVNEVLARIEVPSASYELVRVFHAWDTLNAGEVIAIGPGAPVRCPCDGRVLFPPAGRTMSNQRAREEVMFICAPPRVVYPRPIDSTHK
jgi:predicted deacylase